MRKHLSWLGILALCCGSWAGPVDKPADFVIDLSSVAGEPVGLRVATKKSFWQLPRSRVRKGFGAAFYFVGSSKSNQSEARVYVEAEPLEDRSLKDAVDQTVASLADVMAPFSTVLVGEVENKGVDGVRLGRGTEQAYILNYVVDITTAVPREERPATAIMFAHKKALITVTIEDFDTRKDYVKPVLRSLSFVKLPTKNKPARVKLLNAAEHTHRYLTFEIPGEFKAQHAECPDTVAATFWHVDAKPEAGRPAITVQQVEPPEGRGMNFEKAAKWRHNSFLDMYTDIGSLNERKIGGFTGYDTSYTDKGEREWRVFEAFFELHDQIWVVTMDVDASDESAVADAQKAFDKILKSVDAWVGK